MSELNDYQQYCRTGSEEALCRIITEYKDGLILFLMNYTGNFHTAEDLTEETFVKLAVRKPVFNNKASFKTWLYKIAANLAIDYLRREKTHLPLETAEDVADLQQLDAKLLQDDERKSLYRAMSQLSERYRMVLWLVYFENLNVAEVASAMKKSKHSIETLLYRARLALKEVLLKTEESL